MFFRVLEILNGFGCCVEDEDEDEKSVVNVKLDGQLMLYLQNSS
jgi:hypothetical protein